MTCCLWMVGRCAVSGDVEGYGNTVSNFLQNCANMFKELSLFIEGTFKLWIVRTVWEWTAANKGGIFQLALTVFNTPSALRHIISLMYVGFIKSLMIVWNCPRTYRRCLDLDVSVWEVWPRTSIIEMILSWPNLEELSELD